MGLEYFHILAHTKSLIENHYRAIAYSEPKPVQPITCKTPSQCAAVWADEWWNGVARHLLHPEAPCRGNEILALLDDVEIPGFCADCKAATVLRLMQSDALQYEDTLLNIAVLEVMDLQTDAHIRASFNGPSDSEVM